LLIKTVQQSFLLNVTEKMANMANQSKIDISFLCYCQYKYWWCRTYIYIPCTDY